MIKEHYDNLTISTPKKFIEKCEYDKHNRLLMGVYILTKDNKWIRGRLALIKNGYLFKLVNTYKGEGANTDATVYRAYKDAMYNSKDDSMIVYATTLEDYNKDVNLEEYKFEPPEDDPCRWGVINDNDKCYKIEKNSWAKE